MLSQEWVGTIGLGVTLIVQSGIISYYFGRLSAKVDNNTKDIQGIANKSDAEIIYLRDEIKDNMSSMCESKQEKWSTIMDGLLERRDLMDKRNSDEHSRLFLLIEKMNDKLDRVQDCLHKLQNNKDCD